MFTIPTYLIAAAKAESELKYQLLIEWRLSRDDVAELFKVAPRTIHRWATVGRRGVILESRTFTASPRSPMAYRLVGVENFAAQLNLPIQYDALHPALQREWRVGPLGHLGKHATLDEHDERNETHG